MSNSASITAAHEINRLHGEAVRYAADSRQSLASALESAWKAGHLLLKEKRRVRKKAGGGGWLIWLEQNFEGTPRTAQRYMRLAQTERDVAALGEMSLQKTYHRLGVPTEPKTCANRTQVERLPEHIRFAQRLVVALRPCVHDRALTPDQSAKFRQDLRPVYDLLRRLYEPYSDSLALPSFFHQSES